MRKTTTIRFCQLPKGTKSGTLTKPSGKPIHDESILDIFVDNVSNPYLLYVMICADLIRKVEVCTDDKPKEVYVVKKMAMDHITIEDLIKVIIRYGAVKSDHKMMETIMCIMGIQYILSTKKQFEVDTVIIEGNTAKDLKRRENSDE